MINLAISANAGETRYIYDALGRLVGEINPQGEAAFYDYDAVGNLLAIRRQAIVGAVSITFVNPGQGTIGSQVEIFGAGFSPTFSDNQILFNGVSASVLAVGSNRILTQVPAGATSGPITVTTPLGTAVSSNPFTVLGTLTLSSPVNLIAVGRQTAIGITLDPPAPAGGVTVTLTSDVPAILKVPPPGSVFIPEGQRTGEILVEGVSQGTVFLRGKAPGYVDGTLVAVVSLKVISLPTTLNVPLGQTTALPVTIAPNAAPAGGLVISLTSSDLSHVELVTPTVTVPAGQFSVNATVRGAGIGTAIVRASHAGYAEASSTVTTRADLNILQTTVSLNTSFPISITVQLQSAGLAVPAPAPGVSVTLIAANPACVLVPSPVTIPTGSVNTTVTLRYGGTASLPCNTVVTASAPNITQDAVSAQVLPKPGINFNASLGSTVGAGLQLLCCNVTLGAVNHGGTTVHIESGDPTKLLLAPNNTTAGSAGIDLPVAEGANGTATFVIQGVEGAESLPATVPIILSAPGFNNGTGNATVVQPAVDITGLPASTTSLSANSSVIVRTGTPNAGNTQLANQQPVRAGGPAKTVTVTNSNSAVAQLVTGTTAGQSVTVQIQPGQNSTSSSVTTGGVELDPSAAGSTTVSASIPGFVSLPAAARNVTITAPGIVFSGSTTVAAGLQSSPVECCSVILGASNHGGVTVHIESSDPTKLLLSPNFSTAGTATLDLPIGNGATSASFIIQGAEGAGPLPAPLTLSISAPGFTGLTVNATVVQPAFDLVGLPATTTTFSNNSDLSVRVGYAIPSGLNFQAVRAGGTPKTATITNSNAAVGRLVTLGASGQSVTVQISPGQNSSPNSATVGGVAFDPAEAGSTTISATIPGMVGTPGATKNVTVNAPGMTFTGLPGSVGAGLQSVCCSVALGASNHGGVTVHIESSDPSKVLLAPDALTPGVAALNIFVANGATQASFAIQGLETASPLPSVVQIFAAAPGFNSGSNNATVVQPAFDIASLATTITTLSPNDDFFIRVGTASSGNVGLQQLQAVRAGGTTKTITVTNSNSTVAQLVTGATAGNSVTVQISPGQSESPQSVATGGVALDPLSAGNTTVSATIPGLTATQAATRAITVTAPGITFGGLPHTVGAGLQTSTGNCCSVHLGASNHGGVTVHIESSDPSKLLLSPNLSTAGTAAIDLPIANGATSATFIIQGVEGTNPLPSTVAITASASGFTNGTTTASIVQPAFDLVGLPSNTTSLSANHNLSVRTGIPNASNALQDLQAVRAGGPPKTATITNSNAAVGQLVTGTTTGQSATVQIQPGQSSSPNSVPTGGVAFDPLAAGSTTVSATIPEFVSTQGATRNVTVSP